MMEEQWLAYLRENNPELYTQAVESVKWAAEWRDKELAAANARVAELEEKLMAQTEMALQEMARREQAEAQCATMQTAINRYVIGNIELLNAMKAALEEKP